MEILTKKDFIEMPWKNGGGMTTELMRISDNDKLCFRLSVAKVSSDGPFSLFPGLERSLLILHGDGVRLSSPEFKTTLTKSSDPFHFSGDIPIDCKLLGNDVTDFNVMTAIEFGTADVIKIRDTQVVAGDETYIFHFEKFELVKLRRNEVYFVNGTGIVVELKRRPA